MQKVTSYKRKGKNGESIWLDYRHNGERKQERTGLVILYGKDTVTKQLNKETLIRLQHLIFEKQKQLMDGIIAPTAIKRQRTDFFEYFTEYMELHPSKERRHTATLRKLKQFWGKPVLPLTEVNEKMLMRFKIYLEEHLSGETPYDYFKALKMIIKQATKEGLFVHNPAEDITVSKQDGEAKNALTVQELQLLYNSDCPNETVKRAFIFSCYTGLRYGDATKLRWQHITQDNILKIVQAKTNHPVAIPLGEIALLMAGARRGANDLVFPLPTSNGTNKSIRAWTKSAGLEKKITYHCARHTFATLLHSNGVDILTTSHAMGHRSMKETPRYVKISNMTINSAVLQMPSIR